jgi:hypothetical protein
MEGKDNCELRGLEFGSGAYSQNACQALPRLPDLALDGAVQTTADFLLPVQTGRPRILAFYRILEISMRLIRLLSSLGGQPCASEFQLYVYGRANIWILIGVYPRCKRFFSIWRASCKYSISPSAFTPMNRNTIAGVQRTT